MSHDILMKHTSQSDNKVIIRKQSYILTPGQFDYFEYGL